MASAVPSTMGTLMASGLMNAGKVLKGTEQLTSAQEAQLFEAYLEGVKNRGKAEVGDKTFLDGLAPAVKVLAEAAQAGPIGAEAAQAAADAAWKAFENTRGMLARHCLLYTSEYGIARPPYNESLKEIFKKKAEAEAAKKK